MNTFRRFSRYLFRYWRHIAATMLATTLFVSFSAAAYWLAGSFLQVLFIGDVGGISDASAGGSLNDTLKQYTSLLVQGGSHQQTLFRTALAIVLAFLGKNFFGYMQLFFVSFVEQRVIKDLRDQIFDHFMLQDLAFFGERKRGYLISTTLNDVQQLNQALNKSFTKAIRDPFNAIVLYVLLLSISPKLTLAATVVIPSIGWIVIILGKRIKRYAALVQESIAKVTTHLHESLSGIRILKAFVAEPFEKKRFDDIVEEQYSHSITRERFKRMVIPVNEFIGMLIFCVILYIGGNQVFSENQLLQSEDFMRFLVILFGLLNPVLSLGSLYTNVRLAEASGQRVFDVLDSKPGLLNDGKKQPLRDEFESFSLTNISFRYADDLPNVLQNIDLTIKRGDRIAIVGQSGSGKSTLLNLIPRFYDPTEGVLRFNTDDIKTFDLYQYRRLFGIVTQQVILFHDTIRSNIAYGDISLSDEAIIEAAKAANAHSFIEELPDRYNTIVGEQGSLFSGGQRQRISIARALLRDPEIVLLDEATSALDPESEQAVKQALDKLTTGRTVLLVTHRIASVRDYERIIVLNEGQMEAIGNHDNLIESSPTYRNLAEKQRQHS